MIDSDKVVVSMELVVACLWCGKEEQKGQGGFRRKQLERHRVKNERGYWGWSPVEHVWECKDCFPKPKGGADD